jgi:hypothetical protein
MKQYAAGKTKAFGCLIVESLGYRETSLRRLGH